MDKFLKVADFAKKWNMSERGVRNYCNQGKIEGAVLEGKTWKIPYDAKKPIREKKGNTLLDRLRFEKRNRVSGGIYHKVQVDLTYNSNHIEGSKLTHDQTFYIFDTHTISVEDSAANTDDIIETANHFRCIDMVIDNANRELSARFIKELHKTLKSGTTDSRKTWFKVGEYKKLPNEVGGIETTKPDKVEEKMSSLINKYNSKEKIRFDDILDFHCQFEKIHPFQDGNGRVGRLIIFKECLKHNICPFIIDDEHKMYYYRGLKEWKNEKGYLRDTCLLMQDNFKKILDYFEINYED